eukprot:386637_1
MRAGLKFDKPVVGMQPMRFTRQDRQYNAQGINPMYANVMAHDTGLSNLPASGTIPKPLVSMKEWLTHPTFFGRFKIDSKDVVGKVLWSTGLGPGANLLGTGLGESWQPTMAEYMAILATQWRGGMKYVFVAVGAKQ